MKIIKNSWKKKVLCEHIPFRESVCESLPFTVSLSSLCSEDLETQYRACGSAAKNGSAMFLGCWTQRMRCGRSNEAQIDAGPGKV